mgnify:FL=1
MRKIFANLKSVVAFAVVAAMTLSVSCTYDDTALTKRVDKVEKDLAALTERVNALENESLEDLLAGKLVITGVATDEATGNTTITLSDGSTVTVLAEAETLQYRTENGVLEISADGETWVAVTAPAECVVKSVVVNEDGSVTIVLADGTEATLGVAELIECAATRSQVYVIAETTKAVPFTINDAVEDINVMNQPFGWSATVEEATAEGDDDFDMGVLAAGGTEYVLNINGPSKALVNAGMAAKEGIVSVHFNTAAGACKVMNVAVNLAEITLNVDAAGNITITNTMAIEQTNRFGETFTDFADFYIGVMPKALYDAHGVNALDEDYLQWGEFESAVSTQRSTGLGNVTDLQQYEEGVYEQEVIELTVDQLGGAFWPKYNFELGGEYVLFISIEGKMTNDGYEIPALNNAIIATYKKTIVEAELVEGSEKWNDATYHVSLAGYDNFLLGWITVAQIEEYISMGLGSTVEEILPQHIAGYGIMSSGAIIAGNYLDQDIQLANLAPMSLMGWAPELSPKTEYYFYVYPFNAQTEMDFYMHEFVAENLKICGTFATAALKAGSFDAGAEFELVMHEEKEIAVDVTFSEAVTSVYYNWYSESFCDAEMAVNDIMASPYSDSVVFDEYTTYVSASKYDYYGLSNPIYLAIVALNADGEYVLVQKEFTYVEPQLPQVEITSFEYVARYYELDDNPETGGGDFVYDITCANGETFRLGLYWPYADAATGAILNGTYNYCYNALNVMYGGWDGFVIESDTFYYDSKLIVSDDQIVLKLKGIAEYVFDKTAAPVEPEQPSGPVDVVATSASARYDANNSYATIVDFQLAADVVASVAFRTGEGAWDTDNYFTRGLDYINAGVWTTYGDKGDRTEWYTNAYINGEYAEISGNIVVTYYDTYSFTFSIGNYNVTYTGAVEGLVAPQVTGDGTVEEEEVVLPEFVIPGEGGTYTYDFRYTKLVDGLDAANAIRVAQDNGWIWDIKFNPGLSSIVPGDYTAVKGFTTADALEVDTYNGGFQNAPYNYIYPDEFEKVTTFNVQKEGDIYCITMIGSGGYGNDVGTFRCVYIGKIE